MSKIAYITGSRAEWGLLEPLVKLTGGELYVTGSHLAVNLGSTWREINYPITEKVPCVVDDNTPDGIGLSIGLAAMGFAAVYARRRPELLVVLGDRYETFAAVSAAHVARIPVAHIHGGELSEGSYDDGFRHCVTKMSHLHFTAAEEYRQRVIRLGEHPDTVWNVGALGCDGLTKRNGYKDKQFFVVAYYGDQCGLDEIENELMFRKYSYVTASASHDVGCSSGGVSRPRREFLDMLRGADAIIGNSSAGIIEAPALGVPTINVGDRQKGRLMAESVIQCPEPCHLWYAFDRLYSAAFEREMAENYWTPYQGGNVAKRIADLIGHNIGRINVNKIFYEE